MIAPTASQMPMGRAVLPLDDMDFTPITPGKGPPPTPTASALVQGPGGTPVGAPPPSPGNPLQPPGVPWQVALQDDGSSIYQIPPMSPGGKPIIIGVNKPPKLPSALQPANTAPITQ